MNARDRLDEFLNAVRWPERVVAASAAMSRHGARVAVERLEPVHTRMLQPSCWRIIVRAHEMHEAGWPEQCWLEDRIDAVADAADVHRAELQSWSHWVTSACAVEPSIERVLAAVETVERLYWHAAELGEIIGTGEVTEVLDALAAAA